LELTEQVTGTGEFPSAGLRRNTGEFISLKASGFLTEMLENITLLERYAAAAADATADSGHMAA
jgi:hypothetical protein